MLIGSIVWNSCRVNISTCRLKDDRFNICGKKAFPQLKSISRIISLFFREYSGKNNNGAFSGNIWSKPILNRKSRIRISSSIDIANWEKVIVGIKLHVCVCQKHTLSPESQSLSGWPYNSTNSAFLSSSYSNESHKLNDHSEIQNSIGYWERNFNALLFRKICSSFLYFRDIHDHFCEILLFFKFLLVKAGSRSTEHTVC